MKQFRMKCNLIMMLLLAFSGSTFSNNIIFQAWAERTQVRIGETFRVEYICTSEKRTNLSVDLSNFLRISGPNTSSSTSISMINNKITNNSIYTYSYVLMAKQTGSFTIPPATIIIEGKKYTSNALTIEVVPNRTITLSSGVRSEKLIKKNTSSENNNMGYFDDKTEYIQQLIDKKNGVAPIEDEKKDKYSGYYYTLEDTYKESHYNLPSPFVGDMVGSDYEPSKYDKDLPTLSEAFENGYSLEDLRANARKEQIEEYSDIFIIIGIALFVIIICFCIIRKLQK